jgi:hypothetical protein
MPELIFLSVIIGALIILNCFLVFYLFKLKRKLDLFFRGKKAKNLEEVLFEQIKKIKKQDKDLKEIFKEIRRLEEISQKTFQKIGVVRFNPFGNVGGNQSFIIALLDRGNNGFVISSLYTREGNRVYAKPIKDGKSQYFLSNEEKEAISKAQGQI